MIRSDLTYKIALSLLHPMTIGIGRELITRFGSIEVFFNADYRQLVNITGTTKTYSREKLDKALEVAEEEVIWIKDNGITPLFFTEKDYPQRLLDCEDAPLMLYKIGNANLNATHIISIVGTRHATAYGLSFVANFMKDLSTLISDFVIVSGLAYGIDVCAHKEALSNEIPTVGIVGHGLSTIYPASHRDIAAKMVKNEGGLLTEYAHNAYISRANFLARNRIVAGICDALIVVETALKGGSLTTAKLAAEYGRPVFALPGRVSDIYSAGCNRLIFNNSASILTGAKDFVEAMMWKTNTPAESQQQLFVELTPIQKTVYDYIVKSGDATLNKMTVDLGIPVSQLMQTLGDLEFEEIVMSVPGNKFRINKPI